MADDPKVVIVGEDGTRHVFPAGFDPKKAAFIVSTGKPPVDTPSLSLAEPSQPSTSTGLSLAGVRAAAPVVTDAVTNFATSPAVPRIAAATGRVLGGVAPIVGGAEAAGLPGALLGVGASAKGVWAGGKTGWFTGKLAQSVAMMGAKAMNAALPYLKVLSTVSGAQGLLDLAQMAEPGRTDVGFMGVGKSPDKLTLDEALTSMKAANLRHGLGITPQEVEAIILRIANGEKPATALTVLKDPKRIASLKELVKLSPK